MLYVLNNAAPEKRILFIKPAFYREDGSVRIVVAHEDPGVDNWIHTTGHESGTMCFRWIKAETHPQPRTRVVKLKEVEKLP